MDEYKFSEDLGGRVFCTKISELEERLDPLFYVAVKRIQENIVSKAKFECVDLIKTCTINRGRFGHRPRNDPRFYGGKYPFIQTGDIVKAADSNNSIEYTQTLNELGLKTSKLFKPPKLLFTIAANIGDTAILDYPSCFPDSIVSLVPKNKKLSLEYLNVYLTLIKPYIIELAPYSAQRNLNNQQLAQVPVVIPPKDIQDIIISKMEMIYSEKKQKEAEAQQLLDSIDDYLLAELGIELPEQDENIVQNRIFTRRLSEVSGTRFDPNFNIKIKLIHEQKAKYECKKLKDLIKISPQYGANEGAVECNSDSDAVRYIRITDINVIGELKNSSWKTAENIEEQYLLNFNDLLFARSGSVGRAYLHKNTNKKAIFAGYLIRFLIDDTKANPDYIFYYCHSIIYKIWVEAIYRPAVQANINAEEYKSLPIVLPPLQEQLKMANHIAQIRNQAKQLQHQAITGLEQAKKEVVAMIIGDA